MNCYELEQIEKHQEAIETLASACAWQLRFWNGLDKTTRERKAAPMYCIEPITASTSMSKSDILGFAEESK